MRFRPLRIDYRAEAIQILREEEEREGDDDEEALALAPESTVSAHHRTCKRSQRIIRIVQEPDEAEENGPKKFLGDKTKEDKPTTTAILPSTSWITSPKSNHQTSPTTSTDSTNENDKIHNEEPIERQQYHFLPKIYCYDHLEGINYGIVYSCPWLLELVSSIRRQANRKRIISRSLHLEQSLVQGFNQRCFRSIFFYHLNDSISIISRQIQQRSIDRYILRQSFQASMDRFENMVVSRYHDKTCTDRGPIVPMSLQSTTSMIQYFLRNGSFVFSKIRSGVCRKAKLVIESKDPISGEQICPPLKRLKASQFPLPSFSIEHHQSMQSELHFIELDAETNHRNCEGDSKPLHSPRVISSEQDDSSRSSTTEEAKQRGNDNDIAPIGTVQSRLGTKEKLQIISASKNPNGVGNKTIDAVKILPKSSNSCDLQKIATHGGKVETLSKILPKNDRCMNGTGLDENEEPNTQQQPNEKPKGAPEAQKQLGPKTIKQKELTLLQRFGLLPPTITATTTTVSIPTKFFSPKAANAQGANDSKDDKKRTPGRDDDTVISNSESDSDSSPFEFPVFLDDCEEEEYSVNHSHTNDFSHTFETAPVTLTGQQERKRKRRLSKEEKRRRKRIQKKCNTPKSQFSHSFGAYERTPTNDHAPDVRNENSDEERLETPKPLDISPVRMESPKSLEDTTPVTGIGKDKRNPNAVLDGLCKNGIPSPIAERTKHDFNRSRIVSDLKKTDLALKEPMSSNKDSNPSNDPFYVSREEMEQAAKHADQRSAMHGTHTNVSNNGIIQPRQNVPIRLPCSESFLENFGDVLMTFARGVRIGRGNQEPKSIQFVDTDLIDVCGVDIELPHREAIVISSLSHILQTFGPVGLREKFLAQIVELAATERYRHLTVFLCIDARIAQLDPAVYRDIVRLQTAMMYDRRRMSGPTQTSVQLTSRASLTESLARIIFHQNDCSDAHARSSFSSLSMVMDKWLTDQRACQRLKFLLNIIPSLSVTGALYWIDSSRNTVQSSFREKESRDNSLAWFRYCFQNTNEESNRLKSALQSSRTKQNVGTLALCDSLSPHVPRQLVAVVNARLTTTNEYSESF